MSELLFKCGEHEDSFQIDNDDIYSLLDKCNPSETDEKHMKVDSDMLFSMYLRLSGDIAKNCPLGADTILFYEWLDECLCSINMTEEPLLIYEKKTGTD